MVPATVFFSRGAHRRSTSSSSGDIYVHSHMGEELGECDVLRQAFLHLRGETTDHLDKGVR